MGLPSLITRTPNNDYVSSNATPSLSVIYQDTEGDRPDSERRYICTICDYIYDPADHLDGNDDPIPFDDLDPAWPCPGETEPGVPCTGVPADFIVYTQTATVTIQIATTSDYNYNHQQGQHLNIAHGATVTWAPATPLLNNYYVWRATATNVDGSITLDSWSIQISTGALARVHYQYINISKAASLVDKRAHYQYINIAKWGPEWSKQRAFYQYMNIIDSPPFPTIIDLDKEIVSINTPLKIFGHGFGGKPENDPTIEPRNLRGFGGEVYISGILCAVVAWDWNEITITVPLEMAIGAHKVKVRLTTPDPPGVRDSNEYNIYVVDESVVHVLTDNTTEGLRDKQFNDIGEVIVGEAMDYERAPNWAYFEYIEEAGVILQRGKRSFWFQPIVGAGRVSIEFECIDDEFDTFIDAVQIEPDYTGKHSSFYTAGPRSIPISDLEQIPIKIEHEKHADNHAEWGDDTLANYYATKSHGHLPTDLYAQNKGDLLVCKDGKWETLPIGSDGRVLAADSNQDFGMRWMAGGGGGGISWANPLSPTHGPGGSYDDEFDDEFIHASWNQVLVTGSMNLVEKSDVLSCLISGTTAADCNALLKSMGALTPPVTIEVACRFFGPRANYLMLGPVFTDGLLATSNAVWAMPYLGAADLITASCRRGTLTNIATAMSANVNIPGFSCVPLFIRLTWLTTTTWRSEYSSNGVQWTPLGIANQTYDWTPTYFGIGFSTWGGAGQYIGTIEYFRVY